MKETIRLESEKWTEYHTYIVQNRVIFDNGEEDMIELSVVAKGIYEAWTLAKDFLLSRKAFLVKQVVGQSSNGCSSVIADNNLLNYKGE